MRFDTQSDRPSARVSPDVPNTSDAIPISRELHSHKPLPLLRLADWDKDAAYDEHPPTCIHYSIEWKLTVNSKAVSRDTEPNLVLAPSAFWSNILRPKLNSLLARKLPQNKSFRVDDTNVVVSVTDRTEQSATLSSDSMTLI